jgi:hypothetical protein
MAYTTIDDPSAYFQTKLWTGNGSARSITLDGNSDMQPDWVWIKRRNSARNHALLDSVRGGSKQLISNSNGAEGTDAQLITSFDSDGFSLGTSNDCNSSSDTFVGWSWKAGGASTSTNSDGDIDGTQTVSQTAGFSVTTYSGNGGSNQRLGHGLGATPKIYINKRRDNTGQWLFVTTIIDGSLDYLFLETTGAKSNSSRTAPTSSVVYLENGGDANESGGTHVMYAFAEKQGYSKFGSYTGNGSTDGTFVYTGFKPTWVMTKRTDSTSQWTMFDNKRGPINPSTGELKANESAAETSSDFRWDTISNGFKLRSSGAAVNGSGSSYIYMAFAESPFVTSTGIPTTAR